MQDDVPKSLGISAGKFIEASCDLINMEPSDLKMVIDQAIEQSKVESAVVVEPKPILVADVKKIEKNSNGTTAHTSTYVSFDRDALIKYIESLYKIKLTKEDESIRISSQTRLRARGSS